MVSIPGWAYAAVGLAVALYSKFIQSKAANPSGALKLFFWIGIALLVVGVFKIGLAFMTGKKEERKASRKDAPNMTDRPAYARDFIVCARCNAKLNPQSRFCNWCGTRQ